MSKKCIKCGAELPEDASFCPYCTTMQNDKHVVQPPRRWRKKVLIGFIIFLVLAAVWLISSFLYRPKTYEGGSEIIYTDSDGTYHVLLSFSATDGVIKTAQPEVSSELAQGMESAFPSQLYVYKEGTDELVWSEFLEKMDSCTVETSPFDGAARMTCSQPVHNESFPYAALASDIVYTADCGTNEILWTLKMKNGDAIRLQQSIHVTRRDAVSYFPEETPMDTTEDLQKLLAVIEEEIDSDTVVYLYLPPVTYEGEISLGNHTFCIYGGSDGSNQTTFTGTLTMEALSYHLTEIFGVCFDGNGKTGINAYSCVILHDCLIRGWDIGAVAQNGAWVGATNCIFEDNAVGLEFNTSHSSSSAPSYPDNTFTGNGTGILINNLPGTEVLNFGGCTFSRNKTDIQNTAEHPIDISGAVFE